MQLDDSGLSVNDLSAHVEMQNGDNRVPGQLSDKSARICTTWNNWIEKKILVILSGHNMNTFHSIDGISWN